MNTKHAVLVAFFCLTLLFISCRSSEQQKKPVNFIVIYLDDMGYGDIARTGAIGYQTPNIDKMANQGVFFTRYYSPQAVCTASRAGLLTGCYPNRIGLTGALGPKSNIGISDEEETIAEVLKKKGYATAIFGKWHLGVQKQFLPTRHGFDEFFGIPYSNDMWPQHPGGAHLFPDLPLFENDSIINPSVTANDQKKFTTWFTERTIDFIKRNQEQPFFIYLPHPMPHVPLFVSEKFEGESEQGDRKSTRLNSSHVRISYAVFCLKKKITTEVTYGHSIIFGVTRRLYYLHHTTYAGRLQHHLRTSTAAAPPDPQTCRLNFRYRSIS